MGFPVIDFRKGFAVYRNGQGPVWICPHSGPAIETPTSRDDNSDTIASLCWMKTGGALVLSGISRNRIYGIDFNREVPEQDVAIKKWAEFFGDEYDEGLEEYRREYSWVASSEKDHAEREKIYSNFWSIAQSLGNVFIILHRQYSRIRNYPSAMEIITYRGEGVDNKIAKAIVEKMNEKYADFFAKAESEFKNYLVMEQKRVISRLKELSGFSLEKMGSCEANMMADLLAIEKKANPEIMEEMKKDFNEKSFISAIKKSLENEPPPRITVDEFFAGKKAFRSKKPLFSENSIVMEIEVTSFFTSWHPNTLSEIIIELLDNLVSSESRKSLGIKQTEIMKFAKKK